MSSLPEELCFEIFVRLQVKSLLTCKCVSMTWFKLISDPDFVKMHLYYSTQNNNPMFMLGGHGKRSSGWLIYNSLGYDALLSRIYDEFDFSVFKMSHSPFNRKKFPHIGSCNGLVCIWSCQESCLWNPATKQYKIIPKSSNSNKKKVIHAFGYDDKTCDYKVVNVYRDENVFFGEVYTLGSDSWESIQTKPYSFRYWPKSGVLVNGAFHWLGKMSKRSVIVSFDIRDKEFKNLQLPKRIFGGRSSICLGVLEGCLCVLVEVKARLEVWVMRNYRVQESWTKRYNITHRRLMIDSYVLLRHMLTYNYGEILWLSPSSLILYDPKNGIAGEANNLTVSLYGVHYVESLVSLNSSTYMRAAKHGIKYI